MEIIIQDEEYNFSNNSKNNNLIGNHFKYFENRESHNLEKNILIEIEITHIDKNFHENNQQKSIKILFLKYLQFRGNLRFNFKF